jgi:AcrR family transcriptional regulator
MSKLVRMTSLPRSKSRRRGGRGSRGGRSRLPRAEREQQLFEIAHALFAERGYAAVTMDDVAAAAGVTKPLLYNYFGNKERLYLACMKEGGDALIATVVDAVAATSTPADALDAGLRAFFAFLDEDRAAWRVLFDETLPASGEVARRVGEYRERITELVAQTLLTQLPAAQRTQVSVEVGALSIAVLGAAEALGRWWLHTDVVSSERAAEMLIATLSPGLRERVRETPAQDTTPAAVTAQATGAAARVARDEPATRRGAPAPVGAKLPAPRRRAA